MRSFYQITSKNSSIYKVLGKLSSCIRKNAIWHPKEDVDFVFLCGANIRKTRIPSKRRQQLLDFASKNLPNSKFFLAEVIFDILAAEGHKENILDVESELSDLADKIIIILESESAFCELGAFASFRKLRDKIIVINDEEHRDSKSFINKGPIEAIKEISQNKKILLYRMDKDGREKGDGIGDIFSDLYKILYKEPSKKRTRVEGCDPNKLFNRDTVRFVHDLIYFASPVYRNELSMIIRVIFGKNDDRKINNNVAFLCAINEIKRLNSGMYVSMNKEPYFEYDPFDKHELIASFKNMYFRNDSKRLQWN